MKKYLFSLLISLFSISAIANTDSLDEINHLLSFVENTNCKYERNGKIHTGAEAVEHIKKKYDYYKDDIVTAEDFVKYAATKSKMSGKFYWVQCDSNSRIKSKDWLLRELHHFSQIDTD
ncbi:DUF5329 family protein [Glaciecola sp. 1036]|uniref:DUF5329 family protein n=1 Tax=Alteromonadaceae TaxID=72275 RepID=UPI003D01093D